MKKLLFTLAISAAGLMIAMPTGANAQKITRTPLYKISEKIPYIPMMNSTGPEKHPNHVISPDINYYETKDLPVVNGEKWNGHLKNWPQKKSLKREM